MLRIRKDFQTFTFPDDDQESFPDFLKSAMVVGDSGRFRFHMNPSTRPIEAQERGRPATGEPSDPKQFQGSTAGPPNDGAAPGAAYPNDNEANYNEHSFRIPRGAGIDNARATVRIEWATEGSDWDMQVYHDLDRDGHSDDDEPVVAESAQGTTNFEEAILSEASPEFKPGHRYVARVINYAATEPYDGTVTFEGPEEFQPAEREPWRLTCSTAAGEVLTSQQLFIKRGQVKSVDFSSSCGRRR